VTMLTNKPKPKCSIRERDVRALPCQGRLHEFDVQMFAELDGTPVKDAPIEKTYICEGHAPPDFDDPKYLLCTCRLCKERAKQN
jgi:hypothetical protein